MTGCRCDLYEAAQKAPVKPAARVLLLTLIRLSDDKGNGQATQVALSKESSLSLRTVKRALAELGQNGLLTQAKMARFHLRIGQIGTFLSQNGPKWPTAETGQIGTFPSRGGARARVDRPVLINRVPDSLTHLPGLPGGAGGKPPRTKGKHPWTLDELSALRDDYRRQGLSAEALDDCEREAHKLPKAGVQFVQDNIFAKALRGMQLALPGTSVYAAEAKYDRFYRPELTVSAQ